MKRIVIALSVALTVLALVAIPVHAKSIPNAIWCDGELFGVTLTPKDLPMKGPFDALYNFGGSGLSGQRSVSESKPGDRDYNGGRWVVLPVTFTELGLSIHDPDGDGAVNFELTSDAQILQHQALGHLTIGDPVRYFVCPLHPQKS